MKISTFTILLFSLFLFQCSDSQDTESTKSNTPATSANTDKVAQSFCNCSQKLVALNKEMEKLHKEGNNQAFMDKSGEVGEEFKNTLKCAKEALGGTKIKEDQKTTISNAFLQACPGVPGRLADQLTHQLSK